MGKKQMIINLNECTGCQLCVIACKDEHVANRHPPWAAPQPDTGHFWIRRDAFERGQTPKVRVTYLPLLCVQCDNAPCMKACPEDAISKQKDGTVWINPTKCTGERLCQDACPYGVIYFNEGLNIAQKCTWCAHLTAEGGQPRCVEVCPRDALVFGDEESPKMRKSRVGSEALHPEYGTKPRVRYIGLPKPFVAGAVVDSSTKEVVIGARISALDLFTDRVRTVSSDEFGDFWLRDLVKDHRYLFQFKKGGYKSRSIVVTTDMDRNVGDVSLERKPSR